MAAFERAGDKAKEMGEKAHSGADDITDKASEVGSRLLIKLCSNLNVLPSKVLHK